MVFSSLLFTFFFLPIVIVAYYLAKEEYKNYVLLVASICFYSYGEPKFVLVMIESIVCNYLMALLISKFKERQISKVFLILNIALNISILFVYKYMDFAITIVNRILGLNFHITGIKLPIGISFFTFQAMSYVIDVYKGKTKVQKNPLIVALYISFFPQLIAGPIVRYSTIESQIENRVCSIELFYEGVRRFIIGFGKKVILANNLSQVAENAFSSDVTTANPLFLWLGSICFSLQILYDFSGYSDMAIGLGKMFGFEFEENFNYPYMAKSVTDFWRRWHISLSRWFRDYVYIPLGGSRASIVRQIINIFVVWMLTGIWHGANYTFIMWGLVYFILLIVEKNIVKPQTRKSALFCVLWRVVTLFCVNFEWVIFNAPNLEYGVKYCLSMLGYFGNVPIIDNDILYSLNEYGIFIILGIVFSTPIVRLIEDKVAKSRMLLFAEIVELASCCFIFIWSVAFLILGVHNPFIYFNF